MIYKVYLILTKSKAKIFYTTPTIKVTPFRQSPLKTKQLAKLNALYLFLLNFRHQIGQRNINKTGRGHGDQPDWNFHHLNNTKTITAPATAERGKKIIKQSFLCSIRRESVRQNSDSGGSHEKLPPSWLQFQVVR